MTIKTVKPDLTQFSDVELLTMTVEIFTHTGPLSDTDREELELINQEFIRRDSLSYLPRGY
jgi:hypothetical protein